MHQKSRTHFSLQSRAGWRTPASSPPVQRNVIGHVARWPTVNVASIPHSALHPRATGNGTSLFLSSSSSPSLGLLTVLLCSPTPDHDSRCPQSALFNFQSLLLVVLLLVCTCTYARAVAPRLIDRNKDGYVNLILSSWFRLPLPSSPSLCTVAIPLFWPHFVSLYFASLARPTNICARCTDS